MATTTIDFDLDAINPQSGSDGWSRTARMVILTRGSETRVWTEECLPGGGFPLLASEAHAFTIPLGVDYRPLADDERFRELLHDLSDGELDDEAREHVLAATEDHVTDLVRSQGLPSVWYADSWLFSDGVAVVLADVIAAGSIAEFVDGVMDAAYPSDVTIIGGRDALVSAIHDAAEDLLREIAEEDEDGHFRATDLARAALERLVRERG